MVIFRRWPHHHVIKAFELIYPFGIKFRSAIWNWEGFPTRNGRQETFLLSCGKGSERPPSAAVVPAAAAAFAVVAGGGSVNGAQCD